jgi:protein-arginine kinase activator protein McsA
MAKFEDEPDDLPWDGDDEPEEMNECPNCQRTYDDADQDFLICSWCGWDAERKIFRLGNIDVSHNEDFHDF